MVKIFKILSMVTILEILSTDLLEGSWTKNKSLALAQHFPEILETSISHKLPLDVCMETRCSECLGTLSLEITVASLHYK